ncbi:MAG: HEAT repeat domain-containing protein, partial [Myxococcota bacterium]
MSDDEKRDPGALARSILAKTAGGAKADAPAIPTSEPEPDPVPPPAAPASRSAPDPAPTDSPTDATEAPAANPTVLADESTFTEHPDHGDAAQLIDLYFTLDDPLERDACFDEIIATSAPVVIEFLRAMLQGDQDEYVRASAAAELARRGDAEGRAALLEDLNDPENIDFFSHALQTLSETDGEAFYDQLI